MIYNSWIASELQSQSDDACRYIDVLQLWLTNELALQDVSKRKAIDDTREDARLFKIASELADDEERKRQWRVARGEVSIALLRILLHIF